jgi:hypothetical protein
MARYVLLRVGDDVEADLLLRDIAAHPHAPLLTPSQENTVSVEVVPDLDPMDAGAGEKRLRTHLRNSYERAGRLAAEWEADL